MTTTHEAYDPREQIGWLLEGFVERMPEARWALLSSTDGLTKAEYGLEPDELEKTAASLGGFHSLARGGVPGSGGTVQQIVIQLDDACLFMMSAAEGTVLGVCTSPGADANSVAYGMATLVKRVGEHLRTPARNALPAWLGQ